MANNTGGGLSHEKIETSNFLMIVLILLVLLVGGLVEIVPLFFQKSTTEPVKGLQPYTALQLAGRDIYTREGCYNCHSQMIRPFRAETLRYGHYSVGGESVYDHPFQWGSKRTGPDLARVGGKYSDAWHVQHLKEPRSVVPQSIMPGYTFLAETPLKVPDPAASLTALRRVGVPYTDADIKQASADLMAQADPEADAGDLATRYPKAQIRDYDGDPKRVTEMDALVAYLQMLGTLVDVNSAAAQEVLSGEKGR
jgi:cytochrome c oxidase cbb3-type subunit 2